MSNQQATGKQLLHACWGLLRQDRELIWLPGIAAVAGLVAALILFVPGFALGWLAGGATHHEWGGYLGGALSAFAASAVAIFFQAALVIGANQRADGGDPNLRGVLAEAWTHWRRILSWAALTTTVGVVIRAVEERLGILGNLIGFLGGVAWAIASFFVVPILVAEDLGPLDAVKRSSHLIRQTWGTSVRTTLRFGLIQFALTVPAFALVVVGVFALAGGSVISSAVGVIFIALGVIGLLVLAMVFSAISSYARALIYRYATGQPVPGVDAQLFTGVFRQKGTRRRLFA